MLFFIVKKDFSIAFDDNQISLKFQCVKNEIRADNVYLSSIVEVNYIGSVQKDILSIADEDKISHLITSKELGVSYKDSLKQMVVNKDNLFKTIEVALESQLISSNKKSISIAFIGSFGAGIGDLLSSIPAFRLFVAELQNRFDDIYIDVYTHMVATSIFDNAKFFFANEPCVRDIKTLPISVEELNNYDFYIDTTFFMQDEKSKQLPIVDFSLYKLGMDYEKYKKKNKLFNISLQKDIQEPIEQYIKQQAKDKKVVLFHPKSSSITRSIPDEISCLLLNTLLEDESIFVISANNIDFFTHERFLDMSVLSLSLEHLFSIVNAVDFCISSDTSIYHIAGNVGTPAIVFFTTINPELRIKYYKNIYSIYLEDESLNNIHNEVNTKEQNLEYRVQDLFNNFNILDFINKVDKMKYL